MNKHTPGPWVYDGDCFIGRAPLEIYSIARAVELVDAEEQRANARLIAAAPELLEALKNLWDCAGTAGQKEALKQAEHAYKKAIGANIFDGE